ncbi:MAG: cyclic nucleotide-binding domain-containing protein [Rhodospirillales bacterium]
MESNERSYRDGETIFAEGDPSTSAYIIVKGQVELTKKGRHGPVLLSVLKTGEMFGEMGILDRGNRSTTACAKGAVTLQVIARENFLKALQTRPELVRAVMESLVQRLREANERLVRNTPAGKVAVPSRIPNAPKKPGLFDKFVNMGMEGKPDRLDIRIAPLAGAAGPHITQRLVEAFEGMENVRARLHGDPILYERTNPEENTFAQAAERAVALLEQTKADLLIWGEAPATGTTMVLRFYPAVMAELDRYGYFGLQTELHLPVDFNQPVAELLRTISLAATSPRTTGKALALRDAFPAAAEKAMGKLQELPAGMTSRERASVHLCFGNAIAYLAGQRNNPEMHQQAAALYQSAIATLNPQETPYDWAIAQLNIAACLLAIAERTEDFATLESAMDACEAALTVLDKSTHGRLWALAQNRLGLSLYKMDLQTGDTEMLKKALNAYQAALQVFTRTETPRLWADVMNNFAQAALILGEQMHSSEVLMKAINACHATLDIRTQKDNPLLWASTQNNLGSALFMLGKMTRDPGALEGALDAFSQALEIYEDRGASRMAAVAAKNLSHVQRLIDKRGGLGIPRMKWEDGQADE